MENISPLELQQWATNLLAHHHHRYQDFYGTNMPAGLKRVRGYGHDVEIFSDTGGRHAVEIFGGHKGGPLLIVGPSSMSTPNYPNVMPWKPGMYFIKD